MQKLTIQEAFNDRRAKALSVIMIEVSELPEDFKKHFHKALEYVSLEKARCPFTTWIAFVTFERSFGFAELELACMILKSATPHEMNMNLHEHMKMLNDCVAHVQNMLSEIDNRICEPIKRELNAKAKSDGSVPIGKKIFAES